MHRTIFRAPVVNVLVGDDGVDGGEGGQGGGVIAPRPTPASWQYLHHVAHDGTCCFVVAMDGVSIATIYALFKIIEYCREKIFNLFKISSIH